MREIILLLVAGFACSHLEAVLFAIRHSQLHYDEDLLSAANDLQNDSKLDLFSAAVFSSRPQRPVGFMHGTLYNSCYYRIPWFHAVIRVYWFNARQTIM